jgi:hypothetical protein
MDYVCPVRFLFLAFILCFTQAPQCQENKAGQGSVKETGLSIRDIEKRRQEDLVLALKKMGLNAEVRDLFPEFGAFGASVHTLSESGEKAGGVILAVPLYSAGDAGEGRYDIAEALLLLEKLAENPLEREIRVAFLGSEYSRLEADIEAPRHSGLKDLLGLYPETARLIYLDIPAPPGELLIHNGSRGNLSPLEMIRLFSGLCEAEAVPYDFSVHFNELYKLSLAGETGPLETAQSRDFPSFLIEGRPGTPLAQGKLAALLYRYLEALGPLSPDMDYHYALFHVPGRSFYLSETHTVLIFLASAALTLFTLLAYSLARRRILVIQWRFFLRRFWIVGLLFLLLSVSLFGAELWSALIKGLLDLNQGGDALLTAMKILCALAVYTVLSPYFSRMKIPRRGNYFGNAAVLLTITGSMIAAALDLSFVLLFLWACLFALLGAFFRKPLLVVICAVLTPLQILAALIDLARGGHMRIFDLAGAGNIYVTFYSALILLPCFLLLHRARYLFQQSRRGKSPGRATVKRRFSFIKRKRLIVAGASLLLLLGRGLWLSLAGREGPVRETILDHGAFLAAKAESRVFLDRRIISLTLEAREPPLLFTISLESPAPLVMYDTPMPFRLSQDNRTVSFILGESPDNPFRTEFIVPRDFSGSVSAGALYGSPLPGLSGETKTDDYILTVERVLDLSE